jgi:hypothetical protein
VRCWRRGRRARSRRVRFVQFWRPRCHL